MVKTEIVMLVYWFEWQINAHRKTHSLKSKNCVLNCVPNAHKCLYGMWSMTWCSQSARRTWNCFAIRGPQVWRAILKIIGDLISLYPLICLFFPDSFYFILLRRFCCWLRVLDFERVANYVYVIFFHSIYYFQNWYFLCAEIFFSVRDNGFVNTH